MKKIDLLREIELKGFDAAREAVDNVLERDGVDFIDLLCEEGLITDGCVKCFTECGGCTECIEKCSKRELDFLNPWGDSTVDAAHYPYECIEEWGIDEEDEDLDEGF